MKINKWNSETQTYEKVDFPDKFHISTWEPSLKNKVVCPSCKSTIEFGEAFTSKRYQDDLGYGYCVCEKCYNNEKAEMTLSGGLK